MELEFAAARAYLNGSNDKSEVDHFFRTLHVFAGDLAKAHMENLAFDAQVRSLPQRAHGCVLCAPAGRGRGFPWGGGEAQATI